MRESFKNTLLKRILIDYVESSKLYKYRYISYIWMTYNVSTKKARRIKKRESLHV